MKDRKLVSYDVARHQIKDADLLLFRPRRWWTRLFAVAARSEYVHAAMAAWWHDRLMCVEMRTGGGRAVLLSNIVKQFPGACDVYAASPTGPGEYGPKSRFSRLAAVKTLIGITGTKYGHWNLWRAALYHLPIVRLFMKPDNDDAETSKWPPFCSAAVSLACRAGGVDPCPELADRITEPGNLANTTFFTYKFTLV